MFQFKRIKKFFLKKQTLVYNAGKQQIYFTFYIQTAITYIKPVDKEMNRPYESQSMVTICIFDNINGNVHLN